MGESSPSRAHFELLPDFALGREDWITIRQEVEHTAGVLTIQKVRYRDILDYTIQVDESLTTCTS